MKKFKFSLEKVKELKETEEKLIQRELAVLQKQIFEKKTEQDNISKKIKHQWDNKTKLNQRKSSAEMMAIFNYINMLEYKLEEITDELELLKYKEIEIKEKLYEKVKERKTLEKLKETKEIAYKKEVKKHDQEFLDEISANIFSMKKRGRNVQ